MEGSKKHYVDHYVDNAAQFSSAGLIIRQKEPKNLEAPFDRIDSYLTPTGLFYIRTNAGRRRNFRLVTAPEADPRPERWREIIPHREDVMLEEVDVFAGHYIVLERAGGLNRLRVERFDDGIARYVEFPEPAYDVEAEINPEFDASAYRFHYQSFITPPTVYDYEVAGGALHVLKRQEVLGDYDPTRYRVERLHADAPDGARVPISM